MPDQLATRSHLFQKPLPVCSVSVAALVQLFMYISKDQVLRETIQIGIRGWNLLFVVDPDCTVPGPEQSRFQTLLQRCYRVFGRFIHGVVQDGVEVVFAVLAFAHRHHPRLADDLDEVETSWNEKSTLVAVLMATVAELRQMTTSLNDFHMQAEEKTKQL